MTISQEELLVEINTPLDLINPGLTLIRDSLLVVLKIITLNMGISLRHTLLGLISSLDRMGSRMGYLLHQESIVQKCKRKPIRKRVLKLTITESLIRNNPLPNQLFSVILVMLLIIICQIII